jgi:hypothetical protein
LISIFQNPAKTGLRKLAMRRNNATLKFRAQFPIEKSLNIFGGEILKSYARASNTARK